MQVFQTETAFAGAVRAGMTEDMQAEVTQALEAGILTGEREAQAEAGDMEGLNLRVGAWVLRDQDIPVIEIISAVGSGIVAVAATGPLGLAAVMNGVTSFARIAWNTWRKSARLGRDEIAVLGLVEVLGPISEGDLLFKANQMMPDLALDDVSAALLSLTDVELVDGDIVELIRKDASGRWVSR